MRVCVFFFIPDLIYEAIILRRRFLFRRIPEDLL